MLLTELNGVAGHYKYTKDYTGLKLNKRFNSLNIESITHYDYNQECTLSWLDLQPNILLFLVISDNRYVTDKDDLNDYRAAPIDIENVSISVSYIFKREFKNLEFLNKPDIVIEELKKLASFSEYFDINHSIYYRAYITQQIKRSKFITDMKLNIRLNSRQGLKDYLEIKKRTIEKLIVNKLIPNYYTIL